MGPGASSLRTGIVQLWRKGGLRKFKRRRRRAQNGFGAFTAQPAGAPAFSAASAGGSPGSHALAMKRRPVTPLEAADINQQIGAFMTSGWTKVDRSGTSASGIILV